MATQIAETTFLRSTEQQVEDELPWSDKQLQGVPRDIVSFLTRLLVPVYVMEEGNECTKAYVHYYEQRVSSRSHVFTRLPVHDIRAAGSRAEGFNCPKYRKRDDWDVKYTADLDMMFFVDSRAFKYDIGMEEISDCINYARIKKLSSESYLLHKECVNEYDNSSMQGPAFTLGEVPDYEFVMAITWPTWPSHIAAEWTGRHRNGWPNEDTISTALKQQFCLVPVGRKDSATCEEEFRYSFSLAEIILAKSLTTAQKHAYVIIKLLYSRYLKMYEISSYCIKTIFFHTCELYPSDCWNNDLLLSVEFILDEIIRVYKKRILAHYFNIYFNLLSTITADQAAAVVDKVRYIRTNILRHILLFDKTYKFSLRLPRPITEYVPSLHSYLSHLVDSREVKNKCVDKYCTYFTSRIQLWVSHYRLPHYEEKITEDVALGLKLFHEYTRAASAIVYEYIMCNPDISSTHVLAWIIDHVVQRKHKYDPHTQSIAVALIVLYVSRYQQHKNVLIDIESVNVGNPILNIYYSDRSSQPRTRSILYMLPIMMKWLTRCVENREDFIHNLALFSYTCNDRDSISQRINKQSLGVILDYLSDVS